MKGTLIPDDSDVSWMDALQMTLTKREYIAVLAWKELMGKYGPLIAAETAVKYADTLLAELEKTEVGNGQSGTP